MIERHRKREELKSSLIVLASKSATLIRLVKHQIDADIIHEEEEAHVRDEKKVKRGSLSEEKLPISVDILSSKNQE